MDDNKRSILEQRRRQLQVKMLATSYIDKNITPIQEVIDFLGKYRISYQIVGLVYTPAEYLPYLEQAIAQAPYTAYGFHAAHLQNPDLEQLLDTLFDRYPSANPLRYVPDLLQYADYGRIPSDSGLRDGLQQVMQALTLKDQKVYLHYLHYSLVLEVSLTALCAHEHEDLFSTWHGETIIFSNELDWLIVFTLEEEWLGGKK